MTMRPRLLPRELTETLSARLAPLGLPDLARATRLLTAPSYMLAFSGQEVTLSAAGERHLKEEIASAIVERRAFGAWRVGRLIGVMVMRGTSVIALMVAEPEQRKGFGSGLLMLAEDILKAAGAAHLEMWCPVLASTGKSMLEDQGFEAVVNEEAPAFALLAPPRAGPRGKRVPAWRMIKALPPAGPFAVSVRPMLGRDVEDVGAFWHAAFQASHDGLVPQTLLALRTRAFFERGSRALLPNSLVALVGEQPVGLATLVGRELNQFYVDPDFHGSGIAQHLMTAVIDAFLQRGIAAPHLFCVIGNQRAKAFYEKSGWRMIGRERVTPHGAPMIDGGRLTVECERMTFGSG